MGDLLASVPRLLEQASKRTRCHRILCHIRGDCQHYSVHAEWMGCCRWRISRNERQHSFSDEGRRASGRIILFAQAGCGQVDGQRNDESSHQDAGKDNGRPRSSQRGSRIQPAARLDGDHICVLRIHEVASICRAGDGSVHQQQPVHLLAVPGFWLPRRSPVLGSIGMDDLRALVCGILGQEARDARISWSNRYIHNDIHDHPVHAEWLGSGSRVPRDGRRGAIPDEGYRSSCRVRLLAEAGPREGVASQ